MIKRLRIDNYRLFDNFEIADIGRVNVVSGKNNSGKTTLLEAMFLLGSAGNPNIMMTNEIVRNAKFDKNRIGVTTDILWKPLFRNLDITRRFCIESWHSVHGKTSLSASISRAKQVKYPVDSDVQIMQSSFSRNRKLELKYRHKSINFSTSILEVVGALNMNIVDYNPPYEIRIVSENEPIGKSDSTAFGALRQAKKSDLILRTIQSMDPRITSIEESSTSGESMIWADIGLKELVPLSVLGNGITHTVRLLTTMLHCRDGVLLIDKVENGLHYSFFPMLWSVINEASKQFNVQVIATTHSFECVFAALDLPDFSEFRYHRLDRDESSVRCVTYDRDAVATAAEFRFEIR